MKCILKFYSQFKRICKTIFPKISIFLILMYCVNIVPAFADNPDAVLINQQTDLSIINTKLFTTRSYELKINNRLGEKYTNISIPFSKLCKVSKIEAYVKDKNGVIVKKLNSGDIKERSLISEGAFYDDYFVKEFTLNHNVYPYTLFYSYQSQETEFISLDSWSPVIDYDIPTLNATLTVDVPSDYKINYSTQLVDSFNLLIVQNRLKYKWMASYRKLIESEIYTPDISVLVPKVVVVPDKFKYDHEGSFASWEIYGNWEASLLEGLSNLPDEEKQHINFLITGIKNDKDKIRILYHYLQDATRYVNVSIETGGMKPYPASYVALNKYGDCKALSNYFKSVLSYVGIQSYYTNVSAGDKIRKIDQNFPSMQFDHVILCVPLTNDTIWLDCTSDGPFNHLGTFTQNRFAFLIDKNNSHFKQTPVLSKSEVLDSRTIQVKSENSIFCNLHNTFRGDSFDYLSELQRSVNDSKKSQIIRDYYVDSPFEMIDFKLIPSHRDSTFITLNYTAKADKLFKKYGNELLIPLIPFSIPAFKDPKNRICPVQLNYPINKLDSIDYQIPDGYQLSILPKDQNLNTSFGNYSIKYFQKDNHIEVIKNFILNSGNYSLIQYKDFYKFVKTVYDIENFSFIVTKKQN